MAVTTVAPTEMLALRWCLTTKLFKYRCKRRNSGLDKVLLRKLPRAQHRADPKQRKRPNAITRRFWTKSEKEMAPVPGQILRLHSHHYRSKQLRQRNRRLLNHEIK